jgi:FixJ family two-component response regulator
MNAAPNTVFIVDDDSSVLRALERLLTRSGFAVQTFISSQSFLESHDPETPGCALLDIAMDQIDGLELQRTLTEAKCDRPVVFLSGHADVSTTVRAMQGGAVTLLTKPVDPNELLAAISSAIAADTAARKSRSDLAAVRQRFLSLSPREKEVFRHVVAGRLNKQIAADLGTVEKTIKVHRARVMEKMAVKSLADLVRLAERTKIDQLSIGPKLH